MNKHLRFTGPEVWYSSDDNDSKLIYSLIQFYISIWKKLMGMKFLGDCSEVTWVYHLAMVNPAREVFPSLIFIWWSYMKIRVNKNLGLFPYWNTLTFREALKTEKKKNPNKRQTNRPAELPEVIQTSWITWKGYSPICWTACRWCSVFRVPMSCHPCWGGLWRCTCHFRACM